MADAKPVVGGPHDGRELLCDREQIWLPSCPDHLCIYLEPKADRAEYRLQNGRYVFQVNNGTE